MSQVWLKQRHNQYLDSWRYGRALKEENRVVIVCPDTENVLVDCSVSFFESEVKKGRIIEKIGEK